LRSLRNQLLLTVIVRGLTVSARRRVGDAVSQLMLSVVHSFASLGLSHEPAKFSVFLRQGTAILIEINDWHRN
jgi:hypothetical protein